MMMVRFFGSFQKIVGSRELELDLSRPITLRELIRILSLKYGGFSPYAEKATDVDLSAHAAFIKEGKHLTLDCLIEDRDIVEVVIPISGG
ncbi:MoaD/ThiS family protein [Thermodesulfobacteriota bacterium]